MTNPEHNTESSGKQNAAYTPERVLSAAFTGDTQTLDGFREAFRGMSSHEQLDFARMLSKTSSDVNLFPSNFPFIADVEDRTSINSRTTIKGRVDVDAAIETLPDGRQVLHDLDIISSKYDNGRISATKREDLFTPANGEEYDKAQALKTKAGPYAASYANIYADAVEREPSMFSKEYWMSNEQRASKIATETEAKINNYLKEASANDPQQEDLQRELRNQIYGLRTKGFLDMGREIPGYNRNITPLDSFGAGMAHSIESSQGMKNLPAGLRKENEAINNRRGHSLLD